MKELVCEIFDNYIFLYLISFKIIDLKLYKLLKLLMRFRHVINCYVDTNIGYN